MALLIYVTKCLLTVCYCYPIDEYELALFAGLFFLLRRRGFNIVGAEDPMGFGRSKATIQMAPNTGVSLKMLRDAMELSSNLKRL